MMLWSSSFTVEFHLTRNLADDMKPLHRVLYGKVGTVSILSIYMHLLIQSASE